MDAIQSLDQLCGAAGIDARQLAERANLDEQRVAAIVLGRWTPSPAERDRIAAVFDLTRDRIAWGIKRRSSTFTGMGQAK